MLRQRLRFQLTPATLKRPALPWDTGEEIAKRPQVQHIQRGPTSIYPDRGMVCSSNGLL